MTFALNNADEKLRMQLLKEEFKLRKKQPEAWTKTKYRKYANFGLHRKKKDETLVETAKTPMVETAKTEVVKAVATQ